MPSTHRHLRFFAARVLPSALGRGGAPLEKPRHTSPPTPLLPTPVQFHRQAGNLLNQPAPAPTSPPPPDNTPSLSSVAICSSPLCPVSAVRQKRRERPPLQQRVFCQPPSWPLRHLICGVRPPSSTSRTNQLPAPAPHPHLLCSPTLPFLCLPLPRTDASVIRPQRRPCRTTLQIRTSHIFGCRPAPQMLSACLLASPWLMPCLTFLFRCAPPPPPPNNAPPFYHLRFLQFYRISLFNLARSCNPRHFQYRQRLVACKESGGSAAGGGSSLGWAPLWGGGRLLLHHRLQLVLPLISAVEAPGPHWAGPLRMQVPATSQQDASSAAACTGRAAFQPSPSTSRRLTRRRTFKFGALNRVIREAQHSGPPSPQSEHIR